MGIFHKHTSRLKIQRIYKKCPGYMSPPSLPFQALSFQPGCEQLHWFMIIIISSLPTSPCALVTHRVHLLPGWALQLLDATCMEAVCWLGMMCTMCICISDGNLLKNRPRASTSEYKKPPINLRLFQNTVKFLDNFFLSPKKQKSENETNFTQLPDSPVLNTINSYLYFNIFQL